jgi:hypothetical protein
MRARILSVVTMMAACGLWVQPAAAQYFDSGSTGADGAFSASCSPTPCTVTVTLPASGKFNYTTFNVPSGVTVKYARNAANTPVTILATGNVTITGTIDVGGSVGGDGALATQLGFNRGLGGPGGFDGGNGTNGLLYIVGGDGLGPGGGGGGVFAGGGYRSGGGGGYLTAGGAGTGGGAAGGAAYGTPTLAPLIGGSGGGGGAGSFGNTGSGGGGGGGAILIASGTSGTATTITLSGSIKSKGAAGGIGAFSTSPPTWGGAGSGGAVRLVAQNIAGSGSIDVSGGPSGYQSPAGGFGRVRIEAVSSTAALTFPGSPPASVLSSVNQALPPTLTNNPTLTITSVGGVSAPATLTGSYATPDFVLPSGTSTPSVVFAASNIPLATTLSIRVLGLAGGVISTATSSGLSGSVASSTASATVTVPTTEGSVISATASFTVIADAGGGPVYADGEPVERVNVTATFGGGTEVTYVTASGREFVMASAR